MTKSTKSAVQRAAEAHTDLNIFGAVISILEGGHIYDGYRSARSASRIIAICKAEQQRLLHAYDSAAAPPEADDE